MQQLHHRRNRNGQVLVLVALALLVLLGIVALAVDGGNLYAERRKMQNAADAGALAGARVLCYEADQTPPYDDVVDEARKYAIERNGADGAQVTVSGSLTVTVVATETATTFFARVIGFPTADIAARASAMCQGPQSGGGLWPLAVGEDVYRDDPENDLYIECGEAFYAYVSSSEITLDSCTFPALAISTSPAYGECTTDDGDPVWLPDVDEVQHLDSDSRGWLDLQVPVEPFPYPCKNQSCGEKNVECWVLNTHPGEIRIGDCIAGESGNMPALSKPVNTECGEIHNLLLFDETCDILSDPDPDRWFACNQNWPPPPGEDYYRISGFGCMRVLGYYDAWFQCEKPNPIKAQVVIVEKLCADDPEYAEECNTFLPGTGGAPLDSDPRTIQLTE